MRKPTLALLASTTVVLISTSIAFAGTSSRVSSGSPPGNTPQNHQNEPAVALDANRANVLVAGSNDFVDQEACPQALAVNRGTCLDRATGVGVSGVYFSFDSGHSWTQPTYSGWTNADCPPTTLCKGHVGPIHTLPLYYESQLVSFGDPAVAVGPVPGSDGKFSWGNGERVYYANLTTAFSTTVEFSFPNPVFNGFVGVAVSRLDNPTAASVANKSSWQAPVLANTAQGQTSFFDKEQIWADNATSSPFFGNAYICANDFRSNAPHKNANAPVPMLVFSSTDGGSTWTKRQVTSAVTNGISPQNGFGYSGCTIRTDSHGVVYLFAWRQANPAAGLPTHSAQVMFKSFDAGIHWTDGTVIANVTDPCYFIDPVEGRCVMDGYSGARTDLAASPSISIANGAPTGANATNEIVDAWSDAPVLNGEFTKFQFSMDRGATWSTPQKVSLDGDRPLYSAPAIAPDGSRAYVVYEADTAPWAGADFTSPRPYHGVFVSSALGADGAPTGGWHTEFNEPLGDLRATYPGHDLYQERVGDYVYAAASNGYGVGLWASALNAAVCPAIQDYRQRSYAAGHRVLPGAPWPLTDCPPTFGNTDIQSITTG